MTDYPQYIPPDFDRQGPYADFIDNVTGSRIGDITGYVGGWTRGAHGVYYRDDTLELFPDPAAAQDTSDQDDTAVILLLLFS